MPLVLRIDVDRPYGRAPAWRHVASRIASDLYLPRVGAMGYLRELREMLEALQVRGARAHVFFRGCTLPDAATLAALQAGGHVPGLHLENSRSEATFLDEQRRLERHAGLRVRIVSKHGSGGARFGRTHHAPYEPERYLPWLARAGVQAFLGNLEDPRLPAQSRDGLTYFPSAFWLEPAWRDGAAFDRRWLVERSRTHPVVLLMHPENTLGDPQLRADLHYLVENCACTTLVS